MNTAAHGTARGVAAALVAGLLAGLPAGPAAANDWPSWRGRAQTGVSDATGLVSSWSPDGENLIWYDRWVGRSTPAVFDGRVCANGRTGDGVDKQEVVACWDAETGEKLWQHSYNVLNTTVPFNRVGWGSVTGDPETGYLYAMNIDGHLNAFDRDGAVVWSWRLAEELGRASGYGGRTSTPLVDEDQLLLSIIGAGWGNLGGPPRHRYFGFDKMTGEVRWHSTPGGNVADMNTQSVGRGRGGERAAPVDRRQRRRPHLRPERAHRPQGVAVPAEQARHQRLAGARRRHGVRGPQRGERRLGHHGPGGRDRRHRRGRRHRHPRALARRRARRRVLVAAAARRAALRHRQLREPVRPRRRDRRRGVGAERGHRRQGVAGVGRRQALCHRDQRQRHHPRAGARRRDRARPRRARGRGRPLRRDLRVVRGGLRAALRDRRVGHLRHRRPRRAVRGGGGDRARGAGRGRPHGRRGQPAGGAGRGHRVGRRHRRVPRARLRRERPFHRRPATRPGRSTASPGPASRRAACSPPTTAPRTRRAR